MHIIQNELCLQRTPRQTAGRPSAGLGNPQTAPWERLPLASQARRVARFGRKASGRRNCREFG